MMSYSEANTNPCPDLEEGAATSAAAKVGTYIYMICIFVTSLSFYFLFSAHTHVLFLRIGIAP